ncbi:MAG: hypothetical protein ACLRFE_04340, partial [Clostridia bacterium]
MTILALTIHILLIVAMLVAVICFENDCKKIIFWNLIIVLTSIVGFVIYFIWFCDKPWIKNSIKTKFHQDEIYKDLAKYSLNDTYSNNEILNFNKRHYSAEIYAKSDIQVIDNEEAFINTLSADIERAQDYIILDNEYFLKGINNYNIISLLKEKQSMGITVKCIYGKRKFADRKIIKELSESNVRVCKFNKYDTLNKYYKNSKNIISIDGNKTYIYNSVIS